MSPGGVRGWALGPSTSRTNWVFVAVWRVRVQQRTGGSLQVLTEGTLTRYLGKGEELGMCSPRA